MPVEQSRLSLPGEPNRNHGTSEQPGRQGGGDIAIAVVTVAAGISPGTVYSFCDCLDRILHLQDWVVMMCALARYLEKTGRKIL